MFYHNKNPILSIPCIFNLASKRSFGKNSYVLDKSIETVANISLSYNSFCQDCNDFKSASCVLCTFEKLQNVTLKMFPT